jgi:hypothetical protein
MKHKTSSTVVTAFAAACAALTTLGANAGIVHIQVQQRAGTEFGAGYTVGRGQECFIITPFHVVHRRAGARPPPKTSAGRSGTRPATARSSSTTLPSGRGSAEAITRSYPSPGSPANR